MTETVADAQEPKGVDQRGAHRKLTGVVRSDKMNKTVVVEVVTLKRDAVYGKYLKSRTRYKAHDEKNQYKTGDRVEIMEHRPLSREKRWTVSGLIAGAKVDDGGKP
jgi:small subunit ribosomal protein S17